MATIASRRIWFRVRKLLLCGLLAVAAPMVAAGPAAAQSAATPTAPGAVITNTSTATFQDLNNSINYLVNSNTVSATVQLAPSMTIIALGGQKVTPNQIVVDTFTLANTGNGAGTFQLPADASFTGTPTGATLLGYVLNGLTTGSTCSVASPCPRATIGSALAALSAVSATVGVEYQVSPSALAGQTISPTLSADIVYPADAANGFPQTTSATVTTMPAPVNTVTADARLDLQATASTPSNGVDPIVWTMTANNGGAFGANDLQAAKALFSSATLPGIVMFIKLPSFNGALLGMTGAQPSVTLSGASQGASPHLYYSTDTGTPSLASDWSPTYSANATFLAVYISGGAAGVELPSAPNGSGGVGKVTAAQITLAFSTNQPTGSGASANGAVTVIANSDIGGNQGATSVVPVIGPGIILGTNADSAILSLAATLSNATSSLGVNPPGGASDVAGSQAYSLASVLNGPLGKPEATGSYPAAPNRGSATAMNNLDFTAIGFACTTAGGVGAGVNDGTSLCGAPSTGVSLPHTVRNTGSIADDITLKAQAPPSWTVQLFHASGCSPPTLMIPSCTLGPQITDVSAPGGAVSGVVTIGSGLSLDYVAVYNAASGLAPFVGVDGTITATGKGGGLADTNDTHDDIFPGGVVTLKNTVTVQNNNCQGSPAPVGALASPPVCPGGVLQYTIVYENTAPPASVGINVGTEPAFAYAAMTMTAGLLVDDGTAPGNTWGANSFGPNAPAIDSTVGTAFKYYSCSSSSSASCTEATSMATGIYPNMHPGPNKITAQIGGNSSYAIVPGAKGTINFTVTVR